MKIFWSFKPLRRRAERQRKLEAVRPVCSTLEEEVTAIPAGKIVQLNPRLLQ